METEKKWERTKLRGTSVTMCLSCSHNGTFQHCVLSLCLSVCIYIQMTQFLSPVVEVLLQALKSRVWTQDGNSTRRMGPGSPIQTCSGGLDVCPSCLFLFNLSSCLLFTQKYLRGLSWTWLWGCKGIGHLWLHTHQSVQISSFGV